MSSSNALLIALASATLFGGVAGCYPKAKGDRLARTVAEQDNRIAALEQGIQEDQRQMAEAVEQAQSKVTELEQVLEQATDVVTRNSADLGAEVRRLREQLQALEGQLAEARNDILRTQTAVSEVRSDLEGRIKQVNARDGADPPVDPSRIPASATAHYAAAERAFEEGDYALARGLFREFVRRHGSDERADDAAYQIGRAYVVQGRRTDAVRAFARVMQNHARGDVVPRTLLDMADAYYQLRECPRAVEVLEVLVETHGRSPEAREARQKIRDVRRARRHCGGR